MHPVAEALFPGITVFTVVRHLLQNPPPVPCSGAGRDSKIDTPPSGYRSTVNQLERKTWPSSHHVSQAWLGWSRPTSPSRPPVLAAQGAAEPPGRPSAPLAQGPLTSLHGCHIHSVGASQQNPSSSLNYFQLVTYSYRFQTVV